MSQTETQHTADYTQQAEKLSLEGSSNGYTHEQDGGAAAEAKFITPLDPVIETKDGHRLPAVPVVEAHKLNLLKKKVEGKEGSDLHEVPDGIQEKRSKNPAAQDDNLDLAIPPSRTHPLFPPLPLYGPPSLLRSLQCSLFRVSSFFLSTGFLLVIVLGALFTTIPKLCHAAFLWFTFRNPQKRRPFYEEELRRAAVRKEEEKQWMQTQRQQRKKNKKTATNRRSVEPSPAPKAKYEAQEGGPDKLVCDVRYYAQRVGLDVEEFKVQTEDGFIIALWHVYDPKEYKPATRAQRRASSPDVFTNGNTLHKTVSSQYQDGERRYPVLLMHGLLQSAGAYCTNDDESLAFYLCKAGYDVWLGNNRCGFHPEHTLLSYTDPRMWAWNIRQMGVMDLPALISRVLEETGFPKLGLVCHSQGTTQTFVALAKEQRPDLGEKISVFCALAPAVYAGPLIGKMYFKFMRLISPGMFRIFFGIHAFIPLMLTMHHILPPNIYGEMGYLVFSFLFNWTDRRWERALRKRFFIFSPVYVSSESMRWWLGRECFAKHKCILSTKEQGRIEEMEDDDNDDNDDENVNRDSAAMERQEEIEAQDTTSTKGRTAWYDSRVPPFALWVAGSDGLVDGRRLVRRFERGREPHVKVVHSKVIDEYEHLDVLWAVDSIEKVGKEVKEVLWKTMGQDAKAICRNIEGVNINANANNLQSAQEPLAAE